jgi:hypothetical protein
MELFANPRQVRMQTNASRTGLFRYARERRRELGRAAVAGRYCHPFPSRPRGNVLHRAPESRILPAETMDCGVTVTSAPQIPDLHPAWEPGPIPCVQWASASMNVN